MDLSCAQCGKRFSIAARQLGLRGRCPHCRAEIQLPKASGPGEELAELHAPKAWREQWMSLLGTVFVHAVALGLLALIPYQVVRTEQPPVPVQLGRLPFKPLTHRAPQESLDDPVDRSVAETVPDDLELPETPLRPDRQVFDVQLLDSGDAERAAVDLRSARVVDGNGLPQEGFEQLIRQLQQDGLEIVITFDSTGSMGGEIQQVKTRIHRIGAVLFRLVPKTRISVCTYRDTGEQYVVRGLPFTDNLGDVVKFLDTVSAAGGGDDPEAVDDGLAWAVAQNRFTPTARKVILLFGDAPPHADARERCLKLARDFRRDQQGVVSTVTCHSNQRLPAFIEIAQMGGGEAFLTQDEREIVAQLMVLVFGSQFRQKVLAAFDLLGD